MILQSREDDLYEGTSFSLTCVVSPNKTGVDTAFEVLRSFSGPETSLSDRIDTFDTEVADDIEITLIFSPLTMNDTGEYLCFATGASVLPTVTNSDLIMNRTMLSILREYNYLQLLSLRMTFFIIDRSTTSKCNDLFSSLTTYSWRWPHPFVFHHHGRLFDSFACFKVELNCHKQCLSN